MKCNRNNVDTLANLVNDVLSFLAMDVEDNPIFVIFRNTLLYLIIDKSEDKLFS